MAKRISYKEKYEAEATKWETLKKYLEKAQSMSNDFPDNRINYDKVTVSQILFIMNTLEE